MNKPFENALWIWNDGAQRENAYVSFCFSAELSGEAPFIRISADTDYALYCGDELLAFGQFADYPFDKVYDEIDLSALSSGEHVFTVHCYHQGWDSSTHRAEAPGLIYEVISGGKTVAASLADVNSLINTAFKNGPIEEISGQLGSTFAFDSTVSPGKKKGSVGFSCPVDKPKPGRVRPVKKLELSENEPAILTLNGSFSLRGGETAAQRMQYAAMSFGTNDVSRKLPSESGFELTAEAREDGVFAIVDTGRENAGLLSLDFDVDEECDVLIGWGEHLEDLRVRAYVGGRNFCALYRAHKGRNLFLNPFRRLGMRYLQLNVLSSRVNIRYAGIRRTDYPLKKVGEFTCADSLHSKIYEVCCRTLLLSIHEHYEDCPWREQALYSMDSRNQMLCGYYAFREYDMPRASIRLMAESLRPDGILELCSPARVPITIPAFSAMFLTQVREYCEYSKDTSIASEVLSAMLSVGDTFLSRMDAFGRLEPFRGEEYWNFYEWQDGLDGYGKPDAGWVYHAPLMAFASLGLLSLSRTLELLGIDGAKYLSAHERLNSALNQYFWNGEKGVYASYADGEGGLYHYAELTNALCVYCGAATGERKASVLFALGEDMLIPVTLSHSIFKYEALLTDPARYGRYVFSDIADKWGSMLYRGATTFFETIDGAPAFGNAGSLCHGWSAIPLYLYHRYALELSPAVTGIYECRFERTDDK